MGKPNDFLSRIQRAHEHEMREQRRFVLQQCKDMMLIAANEAFGFGADRLKRLSDAYDEVFLEYARVVVDDAKSDKEIWYTKEKFDQRLREICGEHFIPWDERYK